MKLFKNLFLAVVTSLLLTAGFAKAAESFDTVTRGSEQQSTHFVPPTPSCVILN